MCVSLTHSDLYMRICTNHDVWPYGDQTTTNTCNYEVHHSDCLVGREIEKEIGREGEREGGRERGREREIGRGKEREREREREREGGRERERKQRREGDA